MSHRKSAVAWSLLLGVTTLSAGCAAEAGRSPGSASEASAASTSSPLGLRTSRVFTDGARRPEFRLRDMRGGTFDFRAGTEGHLTLLFFGYTHCPDVCPVHMSNIAEVKRDLGVEVGREMRVVFVTVDPLRDTPTRLQEWLGAFDPAFIGLYGDGDDVDAIQLELGLPPAVVPDTHDGGYDVGHASAVVAFSADDRVRAMFPFGTRQVDLRHDLEILANLGRGNPAP